ncbi:hypothetical protein [Maribacter hydrothermalis]|uniref:DKNYY family protein n=1 Tax=Maribacter hydrothermalis TaxID=1836467 RepID=A0A1B7ZC22_9FLAO|nr:hypothetical protein [Maribacter hydrothermalis]APQ16032.1 hypothetical protein BTR34_01160 [Maribacter hydrothermalis]OBR40449.1 hypothetical protein A9200_16365 [Maribacter hydrothermalis]
MKISSYLLHKNTPSCRETQIIPTITIKDNRLVENYYVDFKTKAKVNRFINNQKGDPIFFNEDDCEWLSPTFIRNNNTLYGFSLIEKSNSVKLFFTEVKAQVDFYSFEPIGRFYAKDKNHFYYGPGAKKIKEDYLELFFDETYRDDWNKLYPERNVPLKNKLWNSNIAVSKDKVYWKGLLKKDIHPSLKRINQFYWADDYSVFEYDLQRLKKIEEFDRPTLVYNNFIINNSMHGLVSDIHKPAYCYYDDRQPNKKYDFKSFKPLFEDLRGSISNEYWWYKMEKEIEKDE